jgi:hypothetical protein
MVQMDLVAQDVYDYWATQTSTHLRSEKVKNAALARIRQRLDDGCGPDDLKRCVDYALYDEFYVEHGYAKHPDVIWRSAERVHSIVERVRTIARRPIPL